MAVTAAVVVVVVVLDDHRPGPTEAPERCGEKRPAAAHPEAAAVPMESVQHVAAEDEEARHGHNLPHQRVERGRDVSDRDDDCQRAQDQNDDRVLDGEQRG